MAMPGRSDCHAGPPADLPQAAASAPAIDSVSAVTLATHDMARALSFYRALGFAVHRGGDDAGFTCLRAGSAHLNLIAEGTEGLIPVGTTGESPTLSHEEHKRVVELCVEAAKGRVPDGSV